MSVISEKVRAGLYAKLNVSGVTTLATGGVHHLNAPTGRTPPYVIFNRQGPKPVEYSFGLTLQLEDDLWLIKAVTIPTSTLTAQALGAQILAACETALGSSMTLTGNTVVALNRFMDMTEYAEPSAGSLIYHQGFLERVAAR